MGFVGLGGWAWVTVIDVLCAKGFTVSAPLVVRLAKVGWAGLALTGVIVAGIGTAAGTGFMGDTGNWAWTGLGWPSVGKEPWEGCEGLGRLGVIVTGGSGDFGGIVAFGDGATCLGGCGSCCC